MSSSKTISTLARPLLLFVIAVSASTMAVGQNTNSQQQDPEDQRSAGRDNNDPQPRDATNSVATDTDCIDLDPGATANASTADSRGQNAQRSPEAIARIQRERDDCLDLIPDANGASHGNAQGDRTGGVQSETTTDSEH